MNERMNKAIGKNKTMFIIYVNSTRVTYKKNKYTCMYNSYKTIHRFKDST